MGGADPSRCGLGERPWQYFVHSFVAAPADRADVTLTTEDRCPWFRRGNVAALQFIRRSPPTGLRLLASFVGRITGSAR